MGGGRLRWGMSSSGWLLSNMKWDSISMIVVPFSSSVSCWCSRWPSRAGKGVGDRCFRLGYGVGDRTRVECRGHLVRLEGLAIQLGCASRICCAMSQHEDLTMAWALQLEHLEWWTPMVSAERGVVGNIGWFRVEGRGSSNSSGGRDVSSDCRAKRYIWWLVRYRQSGAGANGSHI